MFLMLHFPTTIRIYKEHVPPLPGTRTLFSLIPNPMTAIYYISFSYTTVVVLVYIYSMFAFGFAMFHLNSPMERQHARCTLIFGLNIGFSGRLIGQFCGTVSCPLVSCFFFGFIFTPSFSLRWMAYLFSIFFVLRSNLILSKFFFPFNIRFMLYCTLPYVLWYFVELLSIRSSYCIEGFDYRDILSSCDMC